MNTNVRAELVGLSFILNARKGIPSLSLARTILLQVLFVTIAITPDGQNWLLHYTQDNANVGIATSQTCTFNGKLVWSAFPYIDIDSASTEVEFHRETRGIPVGAVCNARFQIRRNNEGGAGDAVHDYDASGEAAEINWVQK
jgi:hypothetical protein